LYFNDADPENPIFLGVYVDDILISAATDAQIQSVKAAYARVFDTVDLGYANQVLGMKVTDCPDAIHIDQSAFIAALAGELLPAPIRPKSTPLRPEYRPIPRLENENKADQNAYRRIIGSLLYVSTGTRPDIALSVGLLARHAQDPSQQHLEDAENLLRYLYATKDMTLAFKKALPVMLTASADSDWAGDLKTRKSTTGGVLSLGSGAIHWLSTKQGCVAKSSTEAETVALSEVASVALWIRQLLMTAFCISLAPATLKGDDIGSLYLTKSGNPSKRTKHIDVSHLFVCDHIEKGEIRVEHVSGTDNVADVLTKSLSKEKFEQHRASLGVQMPKF
jgi:hypothetical protein